MTYEQVARLTRAFMFWLWCSRRSILACDSELMVNYHMLSGMGDGLVLSDLVVWVALRCSVSRALQAWPLYHTACNSGNLT